VITVEILDKAEILARDEMPEEFDPADIRVQGDWESNHFKDDKTGLVYYPIIYHGQRFKRHAWRNGKGKGDFPGLDSGRDER